MNPSMRILTLNSYGETEELDSRVTIAPMNIKALFVGAATMQGRAVKETIVLFLDDSEPLTLYLNELDVIELERVVGTYGFFEG